MGANRLRQELFSDSGAAALNQFDDGDHSQANHPGPHDSKPEQGLCLVLSRSAKVEKQPKGGRDKKHDLETVEKAEPACVRLGIPFGLVDIDHGAPSSGAGPFGSPSRIRPGPPSVVNDFLPHPLRPRGGAGEGWAPTEGGVSRRSARSLFAAVG